MKSAKLPERDKTNMFFDKKNNRISTSGFTLTETMVVVVVFTAVMSLAMVVFLASIRTQRFALFQQRLTLETSYAVSKAERHIRDGNWDSTGDIKKTIEDSIFFEGEDNETIEILRNEVEEKSKWVTVLVKTKRKIDEDRDVVVKLQTTVNKP